MPDFGIELHFWWKVRIFVGDFYVDLETSAVVDRIGRTGYHGFPVFEIVVYEPNFEIFLVGGLAHDCLELFLDASVWVH